MKDVAKICLGVTMTVILTVFMLGIVNGSQDKNYSVTDIPLFGSIIKATDTAGNSLGQKMKLSPKA